MKIFLLLAFIACFTGVANAQPPAGTAHTGDTYGEKIESKDAISLATLAARLKTNDKVAATIKGQVQEVCSKKGCWLTMTMPDKTKLQVKFKGYAFFVPTSLAGKTVVLRGEARQKIVSVNELKHYAEDAKKSPAEIAAITKPETQLRFEATGVLVL